MQPTLPDVNVSVLEKLYSSGAFFCLGILVLFFVFRYLTKHWHYLRDGQRHVWAVALVGGLATLVVPATQGATPNTNMIVMVAITIVCISTDPKKIAAITSALALAFVLSTSSGCGASQRETTISHAIQGLDAAGATLHAYGPAHEMDIAQHATSHADGDSKLASWEKTNSELETALEGCYRALAVAISNDTLDAAIKQVEAFYVSLAAAGVIGGGK
jgi:hypothetical protein